MDNLTAVSIDELNKANETYIIPKIQRAIKAVNEGKFKEEIIPIKLNDYKNREFIFDTDEFPNRESTLEKMKTLKPTFIKDGTGTITPATTLGINDGVSFLLVASEDYCKKII